MFQYPWSVDERPEISFTDGESNGEFMSQGEACRYMARIRDVMEFGDLNEDGINDAVFSFSINTGGTGFFNYLVCALSDNGKPKQVAEVYLDDRILVHRIKILAPQLIEIERAKSLRTDPSCCPSLLMREYYSFDGNSLTLIADKKIGEIKY